MKRMFVPSGISKLTSKMLEEQSPLNSAKNIKAPLLVIQGANDPRVKKAESDQIVIALRDLGRTVEYMVAPDEGHGFAGRENRLAATRLWRIFAKQLGAPAGSCQQTSRRESTP
jgi:dipeptidyl aminopeptidase/acylaminoacyl peptidase